MARRRSTTAVTILALATGVLVATPLPALAAPLNDCVATDNGDPKLVAFSMSPTSVDVTDAAATVTITADASDVGGPGPASGVSSARVTFTRPVRPGGGNTLDLHPVGAHWVGRVRVSRWWPTASLRVQRVVLRDQAGNHRSITGERLATIGFAAAVPVVSDPDHDKPDLLRLNVRPRAVDTRSSAHRVFVTARAKDSQSGVRLLAVFGAMSGRSIGGGRGYDLIWLHKVSGTAHRFRGSMRVHRWVGNGTWKILGSVVWDRVWNHRLYLPRALETIAVHSTVSVTSRREHTPPRGTLGLSPSSIDIRTSDQTITARVQASDNRSGVARVRVDLQLLGEEPVVAIPMHRVSGTARSGRWSGSATLSRCTPVTGRLRVVLTVTDRSGNRYGTSSMYDVSALDHVPPGSDQPGVDEFGTVNATGPFTVHFSEAVDGINNTSATLRRLSDDGSLGPLLPGSWSCKTSTGNATDCQTGNVRTARLTPVDPLVATATYRIEFDPQFCLDVTDKAGNPLRRDKGFYKAGD